jgi:hypothetical protein
MAMTHFSQRYNKDQSAAQLLPEKYLDYMRERGVMTFDGMKMKLSECAYLPPITLRLH